MSGLAAWVHERRGKSGEWSGGGQPTLADHLANMRKIQQRIKAGDSQAITDMENYTAKLSDKQARQLARLLDLANGGSMSIDLAFNPSEPRGKGGKWTSGGGVAKALKISNGADAASARIAKSGTGNPQAHRDAAKLHEFAAQLATSPESRTHHLQMAQMHKDTAARTEGMNSRIESGGTDWRRALRAYDQDVTSGKAKFGKEGFRNGYPGQASSERALMQHARRHLAYLSNEGSGMTDIYLATFAGKKPGSGANFAKLKSKLAARGAKNPGALAAYIGRKKYGKKRFGKLSAMGHSIPTTGGINLASGPMPYHKDADETVECPNCHKYNAPDARYCDQCGAKLPASAYLANDGGEALEFARPVSAQGRMRQALGLADGSAPARPRTVRRPVPVTSPYDVHISRGGSGQAIVTHRRSGDKIGEVVRLESGQYAGKAGEKTLSPHNRQRTALYELIGSHNATARTGERVLQPKPEVTPLMERYGIPAVAAYSNSGTGGLTLAATGTSASDGPRVTSADGGDNDSGGDLAGLSPRGVTIYKKLRAKGMAANRALQFAKRAQNFGNSKD